MRAIPLTQGMVALVEDQDYDELSKYKWHALKKGHNWYAGRHTGKSPGVLMHREILGIAPGQEVDHVDGNGLHNWRENLRRCTTAENQHNQHHKRAGCSSQFKGVYWHKGGRKWEAGITVNGKSIHLGYYEIEADAAQAYDAAAIRYFGEFARLNVIA